MNMVIENVRQLRHDVDDSCPVGPDGKRQHTYDYKEGGCRQVKDCEVTANLGWANAGHRLGHGHAARLSGGERHMAIQAQYLGMALEHRRSRRREPRLFQALRGARFPPAAMRGLQPAALSADHGLPVVHEPERELGAGRGQGRGAFLHRGASRHPAGLQGAHALSGPAGRSRHAEGQADRARGAARRRQPRHAGRQARAAGDGEARSASARACAWCSPTWRPAWRCRNGPSTRRASSPPSRGATRRSERSPPFQTRPGACYRAASARVAWAGA